MPNFLKEYGECMGAFGFPMEEEAARALDKTLNDNPDLEYFKIAKSGFEYFIDGERADVSVISDNSVDGDNEIVDPKSLNFDRFAKNPVVTYGHNYDIPSIGKSVWRRLVNGTTWKAKTTYADRPNEQEYPKNKAWFPDVIFHMIKDGYLPGKSIGGLGVTRPLTETELATYKGANKATRIRENVRVFEYSVVPLQSNGNSIVEAVSKSLSGNKFDPKSLAGFDPVIKSAMLDILKDIREPEPEIPYIENFRTTEQYDADVKATLKAAITDIHASTPEIVEKTLSKLLGRV